MSRDWSRVSSPVTLCRSSSLPVYPLPESLARLISRVPLWLLYALATLVFWIAFYLAQYRRHVIDAQLCKVFPDSSPAVRRVIHRQFIRNYCDVMVEILKGFTMRAAALRTRVQIQERQRWRAAISMPVSR